MTNKEIAEDIRDITFQNFFKYNKCETDEERKQIITVYENIILEKHKETFEDLPDMEHFISFMHKSLSEKHISHK